MEMKWFSCLSLLWFKKKVELYQEAVVMGLDFKLQNKKQQSFRGQTNTSTFWMIEILWFKAGICLYEVRFTAWKKII